MHDIMIYCHVGSGIKLIIPIGFHGNQTSQLLLEAILWLLPILQVFTGCHLQTEVYKWPQFEILIGSIFFFAILEMEGEYKAFSTVVYCNCDSIAILKIMQ